MLRTNQSFLSYLEQLYKAQPRKEDIVLKSFSKGERLFVQHETTSKIMLIKSGLTKCFFTEDDDNEYILEFLGEGEIIGEIELIRKIPCLCNVEAMTNVTVYAIAIPYFTDLLKNDIGLNNLLLDVYAERIVNTSSRASYQQLYTTEYSLAKLMELQKKHGIEISKGEIAAYLGITIRSLNSALKNQNSSSS